ncbi:alpha/beta hydrolase [Clostridium sp. SYSU_GA19001]|uniref:alpha/beta hydrolase n=1 Tax=Clostridium caldaquaticum TaxID=2940653 RepID=UPI002076D5C7|nr:alpha/beta hydrolase [Clostridium caldaquaticum]MCM8710341.1 alpha/beta hydrolase [Clostridium caldaquaticum]
MICEKIKLWKDNNEAYLQTYILHDSKEFNTGKKRPSIIICPGGAYFRTTDREAEPVAIRFATLGYNTFVLRYNTYYGDKVIDRRNPPPPGNEKTAYPQPLYDLAQAILTIREKAENWLIDTSKIILCGFSAGGHLVSSMGVHWQDELLTSKFNVDSELFRPRALILGYPLTDYILMKKEALSDNPGAVAFQEFSNKVVFGKSNPTEEELMKLSPANYVSDKTPPTFIWHTANDESVYVSNSLRFATMLTKYKVPYELHIFESGVHGLSLADETTAAKNEHVNPSCQVWFDLAASWLKKHM